MPGDRSKFDDGLEGWTIAFGVGHGPTGAVAQIAATVDCEVYKGATGKDECPI